MSDAIPNKAIQNEAGSTLPDSLEFPKIMTVHEMGAADTFILEGELVKAHYEIARLRVLVEKLVNMPEQQAEWLERQNTKPGTECLPFAIGQLRQLGDLMRHAAAPHPMDTGRVK